MAKVPTQVAIAAFHEEAAAGQVADALKEAKKQGQLYYRNVAVIRKDEKGKVKVKETGDLSGGPGAGVGAVIGGAVGLFAGPAGLAAGAAAGAVIGGAGAALIDSGLDNKRLKQIGDVLQPSNSAIIAVFEEVKIDKTTMKEVNQDLQEVVYNLSTDIGDTLRAGQDVAYVFAVTEEGIVAQRRAAGEEAADIQALVITPEGAAVGAAVATEEGVAYKVGAVTDDEAAVQAGVVTEEGAVVATAAAEDVTYEVVDESENEEAVEEEASAEE
ncbi:MAG: hypothetical protein AMJ56_05145 [Anaerolineae bacterium SG8_19]|jgi:uncharacterized membrane protein|nr:MAG: hypothetical protein AMJ56_05145 [Anaerolineae bacterium SG8_19]